MSLRVVITGGSGFIGTHLTAAILRRGNAVCNIDVKAPKIADQKSCWAPIDIMDQDGLVREFRRFRPTHIYNLAAVADISASTEALLPNSEGLLNIIRASDGLADLPRIVHVSTQLVVRPGSDYSAIRSYDPYTEYGESKAVSEELLWKNGDSHTWTIVRPTNIWGPFHPVFPNSTWKLLNRRLYMIPGKADPIRSYGYVENVVDQLIAAGTVEAFKVDKRIFYVGDQPVRLSAWVDAFARAFTGKPCRRASWTALKALATCGDVAKRFGIPAPFDGGRLYRISTDYAVPMDPAFTTLGSGSVSFDTGVSRTVSWLRQTHGREFRR